MSEMNDRTQVIAIGIDPGKDGAMAILWPTEPYPPLGEETITVIPFDRTRFRDTVRSLNNNNPFTKVVCVLEHVGAMPGQGSVSMFHFGENFGWLQGILDAFEIPYELVRPQKWKMEFSCTSDKNSSIDVAKRLFPLVDLRRTPQCKGPHDGICEALLMAEYARRHFNV